MSDTEKAALERRIDELCAEVEALKRDEWAAGFNAGCDAVEAAYEDGRPYYEVENAALRQQLADVTESMGRVEERCAKLRELVRIAIEYCVNGYCAEEDECPLYESRTSCKLYANARELGVVD